MAAHFILKSSMAKTVDLDDGTVHQSSNYTVHDLSPENYKQMVKHLKQLKLLEGISVGDHDKFMLQFPIRKFVKGDKILHEGDPNTKYFRRSPRSPLNLGWHGPSSTPSTAYIPRCRPIGWGRILAQPHTLHCFGDCGR